MLLCPTRSHWCNSVMSCEARLCPSSLLDVLRNCSKPAADDIVGVSHIRAVFFLVFFFKWITFCFLFCCLASSNWPSSMWRCDEEGPCPHVPLLLILHFLLILILFHSGLWFGNLFLHFSPPTLHMKWSPISLSHLLSKDVWVTAIHSDSTTCAWHVWFTSDVAKITLVSHVVKILVYCRSEMPED